MGRTEPALLPRESLEYSAKLREIQYLTEQTTQVEKSVPDIKTIPQTPDARNAHQNVEAHHTKRTDRTVTDAMQPFRSTADLPQPVNPNALHITGAYLESTHTIPTPEPTDSGPRPPITPDPQEAAIVLADMLAIGPQPENPDITYPWEAAPFISLEVNEHLGVILEKKEVRTIEEFNLIIAEGVSELAEPERELAAKAAAAWQEALEEIFKQLPVTEAANGPLVSLELGSAEAELLEILCAQLLDELHIEYDDATLGQLIRLAMPPEVQISWFETEQSKPTLIDEGTHEYKLGSLPKVPIGSPKLPRHLSFNHLIGRYILVLHSSTANPAI